MRILSKPLPLELALCFTVLGLACTAPGAEPSTHESEAAAASSLNGLDSVNGLNSVNGLSTRNGLNSVNGLDSVNGLSDTTGLMTTADGRNTVSYLVRCALPVGHSITKVVGGTSYTFAGQLGFAPEWETGACGDSCQQYLSACVLAHINTSGQHIALWLDSDAPAVGWGRSTDYPYQEGSFFGNIFTSPPTAYYCNGRDSDVGLVPGRLGATTGSIYQNPYASGTGYCSDSCVAPAAPYDKDGFTSCNGMHVVTVWRNFDPNSDYQVCNRQSGKCMNVAGGSADNGAAIVQNTFDATQSSMRWRIAQVSPLNYKFMNVKSGKVMDMRSFGTANGTQLIQFPFKDSDNRNQLWSFTPTEDGYYKFSPGMNPAASLDILGNATREGAPVQEYSWLGGPDQQWIIRPLAPLPAR